MISLYYCIYKKYNDTEGSDIASLKAQNSIYYYFTLIGILKYPGKYKYTVTGTDLGL